MLIQLSHRLSGDNPFYSSLPKPELSQICDLGSGDICNSFYFGREAALLPDAVPLSRRVFVFPWMFDGLNSAPCTMFAEAAHA